MSAVVDTLTHIASGLGAAGGTAASYLYRRFRRAEKNAAFGKATSERAWGRMEQLEKDFEAFSKGIRLEMDHAKSERTPMTSPLGASPLEIQGIHARLDELRGDIRRERGARHVLQQQIAETAKEQSRSWNELQKTVARIDGAFDLVKAHLTKKML